MEQTKKQCARCDEKKAIDEFENNDSHQDGKYFCCKKCCDIILKK